MGREVVAVRAVYAGWLSMYAVYTSIVAASALGLSPLAGPLFARSAWISAVLLAVMVVRSVSVRGASAGMAAGAVKTRDHAATEPISSGVTPECVLAWCACALLAATGVLALCAPIGAYDAIGYRLPAVAQWLDAGAVVWVPGDDMLRNGYPLALEVLEASVVVATGSTAAVDVLGVLFVGAGALLLFTEAEALGFTRSSAVLAASLFALVPMHLLNAPSGYADAPFSAALVATFLLAARFARAEGALAARVMLGICAGFTVALKPPGIAYAGVVLATAWALRARRTSLAEATRSMLVPLLVLLPGCFFLVRNVLIAHNPLYPLEVRAFGRVLFPGEGSLDGILTPDANVPKVLRALPRLLRTPTVWLQLYGPACAFDDRLAGLGYTFPTVALPALAWALWNGFKKRVALRGLGFIASLTALVFVLQPFSFWPRFSCFLWGAGALACALAQQTWAGRQARRARAATWLVAFAVVAEASFAVSNVKFVGLFGPGLLQGDEAQRLSDASGVSADFVRTSLSGRRDVCRTGWTDGTDDANLDGIVAQLIPRPSMHVVMAQDWPNARKQLVAFGCDELIAIGQSPLRAIVPDDVLSRGARAFGFVDVLRVVRAAPLLRQAAAQPREE